MQGPLKLRAKSKIAFFSIGLALLIAGLVAFFIRDGGRANSAAARSLSPSALATEEPQRFPVYANCEKPRTVTLTFRSKAKVLKSVFESSLFNKSENALVEKHLHYISGFLNSSRREGVAWHLSGLPTFKIQSVETVDYGSDLSFDPQPDYVDYPARFRSPTTILSREKALEVTYEATQKAVACSVLGALPNTLTLELPRDPAFAYWSVKAKDRENLNFYNLRAHVNPCADPQVVDLPQPSMFWYIWNPTAQGRNEEQKSFDCREKIPPHELTKPVARVEVSETPEIPIDYKGLFTQDVIRASMVFGFVSRDPAPVVFEKAKTFFQTHDLRSVDERLNTVEFSASDDPSFGALTKFVTLLPNVMKIEHATSNVRDGHFEFVYEGHLLETKKPFTMRIYLGATAGDPASDHHWTYLYDAFGSDPFVFYVGHSGMGQDADFEVMKAKLGLTEDQLKTQLAKQPYQLFSVIGCYSMTYYADPFFRLRPRDADHVSDLLLMSSGTYKYGLPIALLRAIDLQAAGRKPSFARALALVLRDREIASLRRQAL